MRINYSISTMVLNKTICLATSQFEGIDHVGGIGTYYRELSILLSNNGWNVVVLYLSKYGSTVREEDFNAFSSYFFNTYRIPVYDAQAVCRSTGSERDSIRMYDCIAESDRYLAQSHILHEAIQHLERKLGLEFGIIEFHEWQGIGIIPVRMKKIVGDYKNTCLIVKLHSPDTWIKESYFNPALCPKDIKIDYLDRYSFDNADIQVSPTRYLLEWCTSHGWNVRGDASVCRNILSFPEVTIPEEFVKEDIIAFFGRIEERKGVFEFIDSLRYIRTRHPEFAEKFSIAFVGKEGKISRETIKKRLPGYTIGFHSFVDREDALRFIREKARLVVIPSWQDNFPNTVLECMSLAIPFITSRGGGIPEILGSGSELYESISCDVTDAGKLGDLIRSNLYSEQEYILRLLSLARTRVRDVVDPDEIVRWYENSAKTVGSTNNSLTSTKKDTDHEPGVTVALIVSDQTTENYLETALESILMQTFNNIRIIIHDSSTDTRARLRFDTLKNIHREKKITFLQAESSKGANEIDQILPLTDSKYLLIMDGRTVAKPKMVELFVKCMENQGSIAAMSCYYQFFEDGDESGVIDLPMKSYDGTPKISRNSVFSSIGPCIPLIFFKNIMGDSNTMYVTDAIKAVGGWPQTKNGYSDWVMRVKLLAYGYTLDIVPVSLFYFRESPDTVRKTVQFLRADDMNIHYIKQLIKNYPELYARYYESIHKWIRCSDQQGRKIESIEKSPLTMVSKKLGKLADRNRIWKKMFIFSGNVVKKLI